MADEIREQAMNAAIKEAYLRQHGALRGGKQYSIDEQYQLIFQRGAEYGHAALAAARSEWKAIHGWLDDEMPMPSTAVLVTVDDDTVDEPTVFESYYDGDRFYTNDKYLAEIGTVIAWREKPQPYQRPSREGE